ncbi:MAG: glycosyltransferase family 39 protein [Planctomycetota bacterium]
MPPPPPPRWLLPALVGLALVLRLANVLLLDDPFQGTLIRDAAAYDAWARRILAGEAKPGVFYVDPLYAYFLAGIYGLVGTKTVAVLLVQAVLDALRVVLAHRITNRLFGPRAALFAALLVALYEPYVFSTGAVLKTSLSLLLFDLSLWVGLVALERRRPLTSVCFGLALGLACLTRPNLLLTLPAFWYGLRCCTPAPPPWKRWALHVGLSGLGVLLAISPATIHNARRGELVLISAGYGTVFYVGNNPSNPHSGLHLSPPEIQGSVEHEEEQWTQEAERRTGHSLTAKEREQFWLEEGLRFIRADPAAFVQRTLHKLLLVCNVYEVPDNRNLYWYREHVPPALRGPLPLIGFGLLAPLGLWGIWRLRRQRGPARYLVLVAACYAGSLLPFVVSSRYRLSLVSCLIPFAAWCLADLERRLHLARSRGTPAPGGGRLPLSLLVFTALVHAPIMGVGLPEGGLGFQAAQRVANSYVARDCYDVAVLRNRQGQHEEALELLAEAAELDPDLTQAHLEAGIAHRRLGMNQEALDDYSRATQGRDDVAGLAYFNMGFLYLQYGQREDARRALRESVPRLVWNPDAQARAQEALRQLGGE